jgi:hypothetical protein
MTRYTKFRKSGLMAALAAVGMVGWMTAADARITRFQVTSTQSPTAGGQVFGSIGQYELLSGTFSGELDPGDSHNAIITDIELAPRNANGRVEYSGTFALAKPIDMSMTNGVLRYSVVNRGNGTATPNADGYVSLVAGWQGDVVPTANNQTLKVPVARNPDGSSITGPLTIRITGASGNTQTLMIPRNQPNPYPPASLDTTKATFSSAATESATGVKSGGEYYTANDWAFADCRTVPFPGTPDPSRVCLKEGFDPNFLYELKFFAKDPMVMGIGLAATRDLNSWLRYDSYDDFGTANPVAGYMQWGISEGSSQSGTFLKLMLLLGFNEDELGRIVWEGMNPNIAARVTDLNRRFPYPGGLVALGELGHEVPAWWEKWEDEARGRPAAGMLDRCRASKTCPKIMETFGSTEIYGLRQSFVMVGTSADEDIPLPSNVRRYYFPSTNHGGGAGGFNQTTPPVNGCVLLSNPAPTNPMRTALLAALSDWVTMEIPPPQSRYPSIDGGTLVPNLRAAMGFPDIPGYPSPENIVYPLLDYDVGPDFNYLAESGIPTQFATVRQVLPQLVPRTDADGNEIAGVKSPLLYAPLGTYTGWNVITSGPFRGQDCIFTSPVGGYIPFATTLADRLVTGDPRASLQERYHDHAGYVKVVIRAANRLVQQRLLLPADAVTMIDQAQNSNVLVGIKKDLAK